MKSIMRYVLYPGWLLLVTVAAWIASQRGVSPGLVVTAAGAASIALAAAFERLLPYRNDWNMSQNDWRTDVTSFGVLAALVDPALKVFGAAFALWAANIVMPYSLQLFPQTWPIAAQVVLVFLIAELGKYWSHRVHHERPLLWNFHAMHHSTERLYSLNNFRLHPFNHALSYFLGMLPLVLVGAPMNTLVIYSAVAIAVSSFQHANIDLRFGVLNYVFSTNELHRWHHSARLPEGNRNYGSTLIIWDVLFKTHHLPGDAHEPKRIGINEKNYPRQSYFKQLLWPYCVRFCGTAR